MWALPRAALGRHDRTSPRQPRVGLPHLRLHREAAPHGGSHPDQELYRCRRDRDGRNKWRPGNCRGDTGAEPGRLVDWWEGKAGLWLRFTLTGYDLQFALLSRRQFRRLSMTNPSFHSAEQEPHDLTRTGHFRYIQTLAVLDRSTKILECGAYIFAKKKGESVFRMLVFFSSFSFNNKPRLQRAEKLRMLSKKPYHDFPKSVQSFSES